jgi:hypothetical protein
MAECPTPQDSGHNPNPETLLLELYRLLTIFLSSKSLAELRSGNGEGWEFMDELQSCEEAEITRILLAVAITFRVMDNRKKDPIPPQRSCGVLVKNLNCPHASEPLLIREACNKIIHAHLIRGDVEHTKDGQLYLNPIIYLYGPPMNIQWKATVDIIDFAKEYVSVVSFH